MRLGDYAEGGWVFIVACEACGRHTRVDPAEVLTHPGMHDRMPVEELTTHLRCRDCHRRQARIEPVARLRKHAFVAGMI